VDKSSFNPQYPLFTGIQLINNPNGHNYPTNKVIICSNKGSGLYINTNGALSPGNRLPQFQGRDHGRNNYKVCLWICLLIIN
jgi:hypothetical protein